ncbi:acyltransferase [Vibrio parahaemolyticus]|uniref:Acetyltransferase n=1 Tax=Vibrio parahaemolyticus TaxID=670 RepID=A0A5Q5AX18_VIBPH|nr:acyltransferase [Vibrio parahaemolyticus]EGR0033230.1 acyltransferase [Vibrio parahaemolyticus]EGV1829500.1 acyltransferase [Vibrio parahaemolyticus]EHW0647843.1 acyltransferase [Vibrio parahaemolyticus]EIR4182682.1 acyltransferase [Vibrio parahaemolyticus]EIT7124127.1 acyltransferase [Vibrio parahaemolyticus]
MNILLSKLVYFILGIYGTLYKARYFFKCSIGLSVSVIGWSNVFVGNNVVIGNGSFININYRKKELGKTMIIEDEVIIGKNNFISVGKKVEIKKFSLIASNCNLISSTHDVGERFIPMNLTKATNHDAIEIGINTFLGAGVTVIGNVTIGSGCVIGANSLVTNDIPPFSLAVGIPAKVVKRYSFSLNKWVPVNEFVEDTYIPSDDEYLKKLEQNKKFIIRPTILSSGIFNSIY